MYVPGIEIVPRSSRAGLGVLRTSRSRKPIKETDSISDYGIKESQHTHSDDYGFDIINNISQIFFLRDILIYIYSQSILTDFTFDS